MRFGPRQPPLLFTGILFALAGFILAAFAGYQGTGFVIALLGVAIGLQRRDPYDERLASIDDSLRRIADALDPAEAPQDEDT